jgi:predicted lipoprotein
MKVQQVQLGESMRKHLPWMIGIALAAAFIAVLPSSVTIVPIAEVEAKQQSEAFDPVAYVESIWSSQIIPTVLERAVDLAAILSQFEVDAQGRAKKEQLITIAQENGLITVGEAHVYLVKGEGVVTAIDTESRVKTMTVHLDGYDGPITVRLYTGPRIPSDDTAVRDAVGFINFGDFRDQTEYGKVAAELNKRVATDVLGKLDIAALEGKRIAFYGAMGIRTFNLIDIDVSTVTVVPIQIEVLE